MQVHFRSKELIKGVSPEESGLEWLSCRRIELDGDAVAVESGGEEIVLVCIGGQFEYDAGESAGTAVFKDMLYVPWRRSVELQGQNAVVMRIGAPSDRDTKFTHIRFADMDGSEKHELFGEAEINSVRDVYMYIDDTFNASRLLVGIGKGRPGGWTVWPPHEHGDEKEELYVYFDLGGGFGVQCVYEAEDMSDARCYLVREGDMVAVPRGYHPNVGCPSGQIAYVYAMAARVAGERSFMALHFQEDFGTKF
jgi:5-deoxy-glucuronate isomerase